MSDTPCFGVDLGTTCSAIALVKDGVPRVISVYGDALLPSVVLYPAEGPPLVGQPALNALPLDPTRGVLSSKRWMGTDHRYAIGDRSLTPVDVAAEVLGALARGAEASVGFRPERVVITVPAWFTQAQRADTRAAGERAGLTVERIINEPTAAALAHAHGADLRRRVLVYDLGGGTFDVSLVEQDGPLVEVRASHGDSRLGGDDIDHALTAAVIARVHGDDAAFAAAIEQSPAAMVRLRLAVEAAKIALSEELQTTLRVPFLAEVHGQGRHLELEISREELDLVSEPFIARANRSVDQVLRDASVSPRDIDELLLVGGSTLQPLVWHSLHRRYGLEGSHAVSPRQVVALGAAIQAAILDGSRTDGILMDVAPYPLSVGTILAQQPNGSPIFGCAVITPRNAPLPSRHTETFWTHHARQSELKIEVFQGSSVDPRRNVLLGAIEMKRLPPAPQGRFNRPIHVQLRHDLNGMVEIDVTDALSGRTVKGRVAADGDEQSTLRRDMDERMAADGMVFAEAPEDLPAQRGAGLAEAAPPEGAEDEARQTFEAVLAARARLESELASDAAALLLLAHEGLDALQTGRAEVALSRFDALSDRLFDAGIYL